MATFILDSMNAFWRETEAREKQTDQMELEWLAWDLAQEGLEEQEQKSTAKKQVTRSELLWAGAWAEAEADKAGKKKKKKGKKKAEEGF